MEDRTCFGAECCDDGNNRIYPESLGHRAHNRAPASDMLRDHSAAARARALATTLCLIGTCLGVAHAQVVTINSVADLQNIQNNLAGNYVLGGNIDASGFTFAPIGGGAWFTGTLDGSGYTISNLTINDSVDSGVGVFGVIGTGGVVENLGLTNLNVVGSSVGASVGGAHLLESRNNQ
jgi:hypothetical protein